MNNEENSIEKFFKERYGEEAWNEFQRYERQVEEVDKKEIKVTGDLAWLQTMHKNGECKCGAKYRGECTCRRTEAFKHRAKFIRKLVLPEAWSEDPIQKIAEKTREKGEDL